MKHDKFLTVAKPAKSLYVVKKSKFISTVEPVNSVLQAEEFINKIKKKYWDATHNVYAYNIGLDDNIQKCSDDGEPSGTAGKPVLDIIKSRDIKNVLVVVTRYFGGIKLGANGLIRAYSESAKIGLNNAQIIEKVKCNKYKVTVDYEILGKLEWELNQKKLIIKDIEYTDKVTLTIFVPICYNINFEKLIMNLTSGDANIKYIEDQYIAIS